jgi:GNAT superfamily N-acetyltransferase
VFSTSPETSSFPIVRIVACATAREYKEAVPALREQQGAEIRELRADDVDAIAAALLEPGEDGAVSRRGLLHLVTTLPPRADSRFWVAVHDGDVLGWARVQRRWSSDPSIVRMRTVVREDARGGGLGRALWARAEEYASSLRPRLLQTFCDGDATSVTFVERRGFTPARQRIISALELRHADLPAAEAGPSVETVPLGELRERPHELFELYRAAEQDLPGDVRCGHFTYEEWLPETLGHPDQPSRRTTPTTRRCSRSTARSASSKSRC